MDIEPREVRERLPTGARGEGLLPPPADTHAPPGLAVATGLAVIAGEGVLASGDTGVPGPWGFRLGERNSFGRKPKL